MKEINKKLEKLRIGSSRKSLRDDLKEKSDTIFSEESSRAIYDMGNVELIELGQASATIQCLSFLKPYRRIEHVSMWHPASTQ